MSILVDQNTRLLVQGITGHQGKFHTEQMLAYGTNIVAFRIEGLRVLAAFKLKSTPHRNRRRDKIENLRDIFRIAPSDRKGR